MKQNVQFRTKMSNFDQFELKYHFVHFAAQNENFNERSWKNFLWCNLSVHWCIFSWILNESGRIYMKAGITSRNRFSKTSNSWKLSGENFTRWEFRQECTLKLQENQEILPLKNLWRSFEDSTVGESWFWAEC